MPQDKYYRDLFITRPIQLCNKVPWKTFVLKVHCSPCDQTSDDLSSLIPPHRGTTDSEPLWIPLRCCELLFPGLCTYNSCLLFLVPWIPSGHLADPTYPLGLPANDPASQATRLVVHVVCIPIATPHCTSPHYTVPEVSFLLFFLCPQHNTCFTAHAK